MNRTILGLSESVVIVKVLLSIFQGLEIERKYGEIIRFFASAHEKNM